MLYNALKHITCAKIHSHRLKQLFSVIIFYEQRINEALKIL